MPGQYKERIWCCVLHRYHALHAKRQGGMGTSESPSSRVQTDILLYTCIHTGVCVSVSYGQRTATATSSGLVLPRFYVPLVAFPLTRVTTLLLCVLCVLGRDRQRRHVCQRTIFGAATVEFYTWH